MARMCSLNLASEAPADRLPAARRELFDLQNVMHDSRRGHIVRSRAFNVVEFGRRSALAGEPVPCADRAEDAGEVALRASWNGNGAGGGRWKGVLAQVGHLFRCEPDARRAQRPSLDALRALGRCFNR